MKAVIGCPVPCSDGTPASSRWNFFLTDLNQATRLEPAETQSFSPPSLGLKIHVLVSGLFLLLLFAHPAGSFGATGHTTPNQSGSAPTLTLAPGDRATLSPAQPHLTFDLQADPARDNHVPPRPTGSPGIPGRPRPQPFTYFGSLAPHYYSFNPRSSPNPLVVTVNAKPVLLDDFRDDPVGELPLAEVGAWTGISGNVRIIDRDARGRRIDHRLELRPDGTNAARLHLLPAPVTARGDVIRFTVKTFIPSAPTQADPNYPLYELSAYGCAAETGVPSAVLFQGVVRADGKVYWFDGVSYRPSRTVVPLGQWQQWDVQYTVGAGVWSWLVDGTGDRGLGVNSGQPENGVGALEFVVNPQPRALVRHVRPDEDELGAGGGGSPDISSIHKPKFDFDPTAPTAVAFAAGTPGAEFQTGKPDGDSDQARRSANKSGDAPDSGEILSSGGSGKTSALGEGDRPEAEYPVFATNPTFSYSPFEFEPPGALGSPGAVFSSGGGGGKPDIGVPEPRLFSLLAVGIGLTCWTLRRRRAR